MYFLTDKLLARLNKGNQKSQVSANKLPFKKQSILNRKTVHIPCTSIASTMTDTTKDEELMPPPSIALKQEYTIQLEDTNSTRKFILEYFFMRYCIYFNFYLFTKMLLLYLFRVDMKNYDQIEFL